MEIFSSVHTVADLDIVKWSIDIYLYVERSIYSDSTIPWENEGRVFNKRITEMNAWCKETLGYGFNDGREIWHFKSKDDAITFKLRWG